MRAIERIIAEIKPPPAPPPEGDNKEVTPSRGDSEHTAWEQKS